MIVGKCKIDKVFPRGYIIILTSPFDNALTHQKYKTTIKDIDGTLFYVNEKSKIIVEYTDSFQNYETS